MSLGDMLTSQILRNEITVEQARGALLRYHHRKARPGKEVEAPQTMAEIEQVAILRAIERNHGNFTTAAKELGISKNKMYRHARTLGMLRGQK